MTQLLISFLLCRNSILILQFVSQSHRKVGNPGNLLGEPLLLNDGYGIDLDFVQISPYTLINDPVYLLVVGKVE